MNQASKPRLAYLPHGINPKLFFPITEEHPDFKEYSEFERQFKEKNGVDFIVINNNRNIRRKQIPDVILAFKVFCDGLTKEQASKCCLFLKTAIRDENGTDLMEVKRVMCPDYKVLFSEELLPERIMNFFYNLSDVCINLSSNEGFGLSTAEFLMSGAGPTITNTTGGLQDQSGFIENGELYFNHPDLPSNHTGKLREHGDWAFPVYPSNRSLQGSIPTPYIFDDRASFEDAARVIRQVYDLSRSERKLRGLNGRNWMLGKAKMNTDALSERFIECVDGLLATWKPKPNFKLIKVNPRKKFENPKVI